MKKDKLQTISFVLACIGFLDTVYLVVLKLTENRSMCIQGAGDCWSVNTSRYSSIGGIPIALFGTAAYVLIAILYLLEDSNTFFQSYSELAVFGIVLAGTIYSIYLTYLEIVVIQAICLFCIFSAVIMVNLLILALIRLARKQAE
jgi:uncharacterized membrane protein